MGPSAWLNLQDFATCRSRPLPFTVSVFYPRMLLGKHISTVFDWARFGFCSKFRSSHYRTRGWDLQFHCLIFIFYYVPIASYSWEAMLSHPGRFLPSHYLLQIKTQFTQRYKSREEVTNAASLIKFAGHWWFVSGQFCHGVLIHTHAEVPSSLWNLSSTGYEVL